MRTFYVKNLVWRPRGRTWCLGRSFGGLGGHLVIRTAILPRCPRWGAPRTRGRRQQTAAGALAKAGRSGRTNPQLRAARGAAPKCARTPIAARASREPRATSRVIPASGECRNPHPQEQQGRPRLRADVRTRDVAFAMTRSVAAARGAWLRAHQIDRRHTHSAPGCAAGRKRGNRQ